MLFLLEYIYIWLKKCYNWVWEKISDIFSIKYRHYSFYESLELKTIWWQHSCLHNTVGVTNWCQCIVVHIFTLVHTMLLQPVGLETRVFLDAVVNIFIF
jgi:hypothetical protein